jgi:two-component system, chemotaxis family, sensor kinase CheA
VSDVTAVFEQAEAERERQEAFAIFQHISSDRAGFVGFLDEGTKLLALIGERHAPPCEVRRALHTLKGNSLMLGLPGIASCCHQLESEIAESLGSVDPRSVATLSRLWSHIAQISESFLGERRRHIEMTFAQHEALISAVRSDVSRVLLLDMLDQLQLEPTQARLQTFAEQAHRIAARLEKRLIVDIVDDGLRIDPRTSARVWSALIHVVRNAVDHGIEHGRERTVAGKPIAGRLTFRARREGSSAVIEIEDDGRGIDWEQIRARAIALGLATEQPADLEAALFHDGLSTATAVTDLSGRGVGMGALHAEVVASGGSIEVRSEAGRGTCVRLTLPLGTRPLELCA